MLSEAMEAWRSVCMNVLKGPDKYFLKVVLSAIKADVPSAYQGRSIHGQRGSDKLVIMSTCQRSRMRGESGMVLAFALAPAGQE